MPRSVRQSQRTKHYALVFCPMRQSNTIPFFCSLSLFNFFVILLTRYVALCCRQHCIVPPTVLCFRWHISGSIHKYATDATSPGQQLEIDPQQTLTLLQTNTKLQNILQVRCAGSRNNIPIALCVVV